MDGKVELCVCVCVMSSQVNTLQNWLSEFNMWVPAPEAVQPDTAAGPVTPRAFKVHILNDEHK